MNEDFSVLDYRKVLKITGDDGQKFLQGLLTNDVYEIQSGKFLYALLLTPQGKILYDFFITPKEGDEIFLDYPAQYSSEIIQKLKLYKLRQNLEITEEPNYKVVISKEKINNGFIPDPRNPKLGYRSITKYKDTKKEILEWYHDQRMRLKIPEAGIDFIPEKFFPIVLGFDKLNAINYEKGCYVGQEVTARSTYRGNIRKKIYCLQFNREPPKWGSELFIDEQKLGSILGSFGNFALALLDIEKTELNHKESGFVILE